MPIQIKPLNAQQVAALKPRGVSYFKAVDNDGLYVRVLKTSKSWVMRDTKKTWVTIGKVATMPLATARSEVAKRKSSPSEEKLKPLPYFKDAQDTFINTIGKSLKSDKNLKQWTNTILEFCMNPKGIDIGNKRIDAITPSDIKEILENVLPRKDTAQKLRGRLERIIDAAWVEHRMGTPYLNPATSLVVNQLIPTMAKKAISKPHKAVPVSDAPKIFKECWKKRKKSVSYAALCFTILTIGRAGNGVSARWDEMVKDQWQIGREKMKVDSNPDHIVPLPKQAIELLNLRKLLDDESEWCFASPMKDAPMSTDSLRHDLQRTTGNSYTTHGWRSTFKDWSLERDELDGDEDMLGEIALAHKVGDKTKSAYLRTKLIKKRGVQLQQWADFLLHPA